MAFRLMDALERAENRAGALHHAMTHQRLLREELEIEPGPERREPAPTAAHNPPQRAPSPAAWRTEADRTTCVTVA